MNSIITPPQMPSAVPPPQQISISAPPPALSSRLKIIMAAGAFVLFSIIVVGLILAFSFNDKNPVGAGWFLFSYAMGLTMIVLPCTLPLAFVIVPLSMGKGPVKGLLIALAFSIGVTLTLSLYGVLAAVLGEVVIGVFGAQFETVKNWLYAIAGIFAIVFALGELGFLKVRMPSYSGSAPMFIQKQREVLKALLLGLFMGNIGVGCPHPATPLILGRIAVSGNIFYGWMLFLVHALGRITPLMFLAILGVMGVNGLSFLMKHKEAITRATGWMMVYVGGFLFCLGFFSHGWWVYSGQHSLFEVFTQEEKYTGILANQLKTGMAHSHGLSELTGKTGLFGVPLSLGNWALAFLWTFPLWWTWRQERKRIKALTGTEREHAETLHQTRGWLYAVLSLLIIGFIFVTSQWFLKIKSFEHKEPVFQLQVQTPSPLTAGVPQDLVIRLLDNHAKPLTGLTMSHERLLHVVIINEDLGSFGHIHAEDLGPITPDMEAQARFPIRYTFPEPGRDYLVAVNTVHLGHEVSLTQRVHTAGTSPLPVITKDLSRAKTFNSYNVSFSTAPVMPTSGDDTLFTYHFEKGGLPVSDLEPYLAATMHVSVVSVDLEAFIHTHGDIPSTTALPAGEHAMHEAPASLRFGPGVTAHVVFPHPGLYMVFGEVQHQGKVIVTSFMVTVAPGEEAATAMPHMH